MWLINLTISLFSIIKTRALECVSLINRKCMPRPKILDVNEVVGEALFYPYNVLVNKFIGSCDTINNPMAKLCVPNIIKRIDMKVYNFLMRLNETRNVLWHESCKCVCKLNSPVCNNKQIWNSDTCRCNCNEDFASIIIVYVNDFNVNSLEIIKRESRIGANIYYIGYVLEPNYDYNTINPLYFVINRLIGYTEEIEGSSDKYLVVAKNVSNKDIISVLDMVRGSIENKINPKPNIYPNSIEIEDYDKFRFNSDTDLRLDTLIEFRSLVINVSCVIEKYNEYYPEIYLDECLYVKDKVWPTTT